MIMIDFSTPCKPDIHSMTKPIQDVGSAIRREIQALWTEYQVKLAYSPGRTLRDAAGGMDEVEVAYRKYRALFEAYHAWSGTASGKFKADPALLADVTAVPRKYQSGILGELHHA
jgi:hypothetical protein